MALIHVPLQHLTEQDLEQLVFGKVCEARSIEYKRESYGRLDADHAELLADISSFANTAGGDIILGMRADAGMPTAIVPLEIDVDAEIIRIEQIARSAWSLRSDADHDWGAGTQLRLPFGGVCRSSR